jgi:predicted membrane-bound spermidine synthase
MRVVAVVTPQANPELPLAHAKHHPAHAHPTANVLVDGIGGLLGHLATLRGHSARVVVNLMNPSNVDTVLIAGKLKKWRGNLVGVNVPRVLRLVQDARDAVMRRAGFQMSLLG